MNKKESEMLSLLKQLRDDFGAVSVKAEFEAEGTRVDELLRLVDLARKANLKIALKIGGCEAVRDLLDCKQFGADFIIAPMIETQFALEKFIKAKNKTFTLEQQKFTDFLFNIESITAYNNLDSIISSATKNNDLSGIVFGRVDFSGSIENSREIVDSQKITKYILDVASKCKDKNLDLVIGGAVSSESIDCLKSVNNVHLTRFETRKVIFGSDFLSSKNLIKGLEMTVFFELLWLENKRNYYESIRNEDQARIEMLQSRWNKIQSKLVDT